MIHCIVRLLSAHGHYYFHLIVGIFLGLSILHKLYLELGVGLGNNENNIEIILG